MAYKQKSSGLPFKQMGSTPAKHYVDDNREHNTPEHSDDLQTPEEHKTGKVDQGNFKPAYEGADYSKEDIAKMSEKEKIAKIDGYIPKKGPKRGPDQYKDVRFAGDDGMDES